MNNGLILAIPNPFSEDEELLPGTLSRMLPYYCESGIQSFLLNGSMGVGPLLDLETFEQTIEVSCAALQGMGARVMINCGDTSLKNSVRKMRIAEKYPVDVLIATSPYYFRCDQAALLEYFLRLADSTDLPFYPYDVPHATHNPIARETLVELARHPNVRGIKCSHADIQDMRLKFEAVRDREDFTFCCGVIGYMDLMLSLGVPACVDGIYAVAPGLAVEIWEAVTNGRSSQASRGVLKYLEIIERMSRFGFWPSYSAAMNLLGFEGVYAVSPLRAKPSTVQMEQMRALMEEFELLPAKTTLPKGTAT